MSGDAEDLTIPLNVHDFIVFAADPIAASWDGSDDQISLSWWTADDGAGAGVGIAFVGTSVGMTPDEAEKVARFLLRGAELARLHDAAIATGPPLSPSAGRMSPPTPALEPS